jgi:small subunit ribosomal protein S17
MKKFQGTIISDKMNKAAVVLIERKYRHPLYGKIITKKKKIHAVNEIEAKTGQTVWITEIRPVSKTISFRISEVVEEKKSKEAKK